MKNPSGKNFLVRIGRTSCGVIAASTERRNGCSQSPVDGIPDALLVDVHIFYSAVLHVWSSGTLALSDVFVSICGTFRASLLVKPYLVIARETGVAIMPDCFARADDIAIAIPCAFNLNFCSFGEFDCEHEKLPDAAAVLVLALDACFEHVV